MNNTTSGIAHPFVSVVIPAYNAGRFIVSTIRTVFEQTFIDWEMIIINDGSTDSTEILVQPFLADPRVHYISQRNTGVSIARNNAMLTARGKYIALLDADDLWEKENLQRKVNVLKNDPSAWTFSDYVNMNEDSAIIGPGPSGNDTDMLRHFFLWDREVVPVPCSNIIFPKKFFDEGARFDPALSTTADRCFCVQLAMKGKAIVIHEPLVKYRILPGSMSRNMQVTERDNLYFYKKYADAGMIRPYFFRKRCYANIYLILAGSWNLHGNRKRGIYFLLRSFFSFPFILPRIIGKIIFRKSNR